MSLPCLTAQTSCVEEKQQLSNTHMLLKLQHTCTVNCCFLSSRVQTPLPTRTATMQACKKSKVQQQQTGSSCMSVITHMLLKLQHTCSVNCCFLSSCVQTPLPTRIATMQACKKSKVQQQQTGSLCMSVIFAVRQTDKTLHEGT